MRTSLVEVVIPYLSFLFQHFILSCRSTTRPPQLTHFIPRLPQLWSFVELCMPLLRQRLIVEQYQYLGTISQRLRLRKNATLILNRMQRLALIGCQHTILGGMSIGGFNALVTRFVHMSLHIPTSAGTPREGGARNVQTIYGQLVNWNTFSTISQPVGSCRGVAQTRRSLSNSG
jgi:hypothetical protein